MASPVAAILFQRDDGDRLGNRLVAYLDRHAGRHRHRECLLTALRHELIGGGMMSFSMHVPTAISFGMESPDPSEEPNLETGSPWSSWDDQDIRWGLDHNTSIEEIADFLCQTRSEIRQRIAEITEADAIGDPSLLSDGLTQRDRISLETYRNARVAMTLIREAVEDCAPPGSVARED